MRDVLCEAFFANATHVLVSSLANFGSDILFFLITLFRRHIEY